MILREPIGAAFSGKGNGQGAGSGGRQGNDFSAISCNMQVIQEKFRRFAKREARLKQKQVKERSFAGNHFFKERYEAYFADRRVDRYKTSNLLCREKVWQQRSLGYTDAERALDIKLEGIA